MRRAALQTMNERGRGQHHGDLVMGCIVLLPLQAALGRAEHKRKIPLTSEEVGCDWQVRGAAVQGLGVRISFQGKS